MVNVADPMYVLAIAALKELIAQKVCITSSVDFTRDEIVLFVQRIKTKQKKNRRREKSQQGKGSATVVKPS